jgi:hypothetical protein
VVERRVESAHPRHRPAGAGANELNELTRKLDDCRIDDRDLTGLIEALNTVLPPHDRRPHVRA